jgi:hypothetical protein
MSEQAESGAQIAGLTPERREVFEDVHDAADRALRSRDGPGSSPCGEGSDLLRRALRSQIDNLVLYH